MQMHARGWLLDLYEDANDGVRLWFILENDQRICLKQQLPITFYISCLLYTSDAADDLLCVDLGGRRIIKKKKISMQLHHNLLF